VASARVFFGGKSLTVKELVSSVGKYLGASPDVLDELVENLDTVVSRTIEAKSAPAPPASLLVMENNGKLFDAEEEEKIMPQSQENGLSVGKREMFHTLLKHDDSEFIDD